MPDSFGARLRQQRERQEIALASVAEQTKIGVSLLEALERDDVSHWPAGIFRRAFIRAYAQAIGLDPCVVVREFLELYPDPLESLPAIPALLDARGTSVSPPPTRLRCLVISTVTALSNFRSRFVQPRSPALEAVPPADRSPALEAVTPADRIPVIAVSQPELDLFAVAHLCTELGRVHDTREVEPLLERACRILDAAGLIVWVWDAQGTQLRPALAHGYSDAVLAQLPRVRRDTNNATAAAFRSAEACIVNGSDLVCGAVVVPLMTSVGCVGVLAVELQHRGEQQKSVRALVTILAAQLAMLIGTMPLAKAVNA